MCGVCVLAVREVDVCLLTGESVVGVCVGCGFGGYMWSVCCHKGR